MQRLAPSDATLSVGQLETKRWANSTLRYRYGPVWAVESLGQKAGVPSVADVETLSSSALLKASSRADLEQVFIANAIRRPI
jgi:hypothetical protein